MQLNSLAGHPGLTAIVIVSYFILLLLIGRITSKKNDNATFFTANRDSRWYIITFGMIGTSISGITFISIPGAVGVTSFSYFQMVLGYFVGYLIIIQVLLPLYYRLNLTSIYTYLEKRYGFYSYKTGAFFFILSRSVGSAVRLLVAVNVFYIFIFKELNIPFEVSIFISMGLIMLYSIRGGVKTIIWTDNLQTFFLVLSLILTIIFVCSRLDFNFGQMVNTISHDKTSKIFFWDPSSKLFFWKQFIAGLLITVSMTGLDQDLMQKNLTCRSLRDAKKNVFTYSIIMIGVNLLFLSLGTLLYLYSSANHLEIPKQTDQLFPGLALQQFPMYISFVFLIGLTAATFASTDSAVTALTTSVCIDFLGFNEKKSNHTVGKRYLVHITMSCTVAFIACLIYWLDATNSSISILLKYAAYTYGPLLGLYAFGLFTKRKVRDELVPIICVLAPLLTFLLDYYFGKLLILIFPHFHNLYSFGSEIILINSLLSYIGLLIITSKSNENTKLKMQVS